ncbi:MAG TPA: hypothetical protein VIL46_02270 [Gemmataceae bacterium]
MNPELFRIIDESAGRYLTGPERRRILDYAESLPARLRAAEAAEAAEASAVAATLEHLRARHAEPFFRHPDLNDRLPHDLRQILRYSALAMVCDDRTLQQDRLLTWLGSLLAGLGLSAGFRRDACAALRDKLREEMPGEAYALLGPFLEINIEVLGAGGPEGGP